MRPAFGASSPQIWVIRVDFPAPFGPIRAWSSPARTVSVTSSVASTAPKDFRRPVISRTGSPSGVEGGLVIIILPKQPARHTLAAEQRNHGQNGTHHNHPVFGPARQHLLQRKIDRSADNRPQQRSKSAENADGHELAGLGTGGHVRRDEAGIVRPQNAGETGPDRRDHKGQKPEGQRPDAEIDGTALA